MAYAREELDPKLAEQFDRYILFTNTDEDNLRRGRLVAPHLKSCGKNLKLAPGATIPWCGKLVCGDDVYIGLWSYIGGGDITLEDKVMIGPHCSLTAGDHSFNPEKDDFSAPHKREPIVIGHGTWLAAGAVVTAGVRVGRCNLIAAGAVVTKNTPDYAIMAGVPARQIGSVKTL
jgi:acetyltransferase-like isoleucine patch superfamily enzyme